MSITTNIEIDKVCRTCLIPSEGMKSLYEACSSAMQICVAELLSKCTSLKIAVANDGLPTQICQDCLCQLNLAYKFVFKCRKSDEKLRSYLNKTINTRDTSALGQITRRYYDITNTDGICVKTEEAANASNGIHIIQTTNYLNTNVILEGEHEHVKTLDHGRCNGDDFKLISLNDSFECINDFKISLREPLPTSAIQTNLDQELDLIKHEIDCDVKTEMQHYVNYKNEDIKVKNALVNLHQNYKEPKPCQQLSKLQPEKETKSKIISMHTKGKNALSSCVNSIESKKSHDMNSNNTAEIISNQPENAMNIKNAVVILEDINVHIKSLRSPIQHQFEQLNSTASKRINKIAIIADTSSTRHRIKQIRRDRQTPKINDQHCTKMPVIPHRVKRKSKCRAINSTEETSKSATSRLRRHQVHIPYTCKFTCTVCEKSFNTKRQLRGHTMKHTRESQYPPDGIVKSIIRKEGGTRQVLTHMGKKSFVCKICEKAFTDKTRLKRHLLTHTGEKPFSCSLCDKSFTQRGHLARHMLSHTGEKPYSCVTCDKTFTLRGHLTRHMLTHTGEKPFTCATCDRRFNHKESLTAHILTHTGYKPYPCAICDMRFIRKGNLKAHLLTHTGKKPYTCAICFLGFTRKDRLSRHVNAHRKDTLFL